MSLSRRAAFMLLALLCSACSASGGCFGDYGLLSSPWARTAAQEGNEEEAVAFGGILGSAPWTRDNLGTFLNSPWTRDEVVSGMLSRAWTRTNVDGDGPQKVGGLSSPCSGDVVCGKATAVKGMLSAAWTRDVDVDVDDGSLVAGMLSAAWSRDVRGDAPMASMLSAPWSRDVDTAPATGMLSAPWSRAI